MESHSSIFQEVNRLNRTSKARFRFYLAGLFLFLEQNLCKISTSLKLFSYQFSFNNDIEEDKMIPFLEFKKRDLIPSSFTNLVQTKSKDISIFQFSSFNDMKKYGFESSCLFHTQISSNLNDEIYLKAQTNWDHSDIPGILKKAYISQNKFQYFHEIENQDSRQNYIIYCNKKDSIRKLKDDFALNELICLMQDFNNSDSIGRTQNINSKFVQNKRKHVEVYIQNDVLFIYFKEMHICSIKSLLSLKKHKILIDEIINQIHKIR